MNNWRVHMNVRPVVSILLVFFVFAFSYMSHAQERDTYYFTVTSGEVSQTGSFCLGGCSTETAELSGTFSAFLPGGAAQIFFPSANVNTDPSLFFQLPSDPSLDSNGTVRDIEFTFTGTELILDGVIDQSAFDGPRINYHISARVTKKPPVAPEYFSARPDFRRCVSPVCGGYFVKAVNRRTTQCVDGTVQKECYVKSIRTRSGEVDAGFVHLSPLFLMGSIVSEDSGPFGELGVFDATTVQYPTVEKRAKGRFYGVSNNGIVCISSPCFSYDEDVLNTKKEMSISRINFDRIKIDEEQKEKAQRILAEGKTLYVSGKNRKYEGFSGTGVQLIVKQLYLPNEDHVKCDVGYESVDGVCVTPYGCEYPLLELTGVGGVPIVDPITGELTANISKSCIDECSPPAFLVSDAQCEVYYP